VKNCRVKFHPVGKDYAIAAGVIYRVAAFLLRGRYISHSLVIGAIFGLAQVSTFAAGSVTLAWMPSADPSVVGYNLYYGGASGSYTNKIPAANTTNTVVSGLINGATYYFAATAYDVNGVESPFSNEATYIVPLSNVVTNPPASNQPTLNALGNLTLTENAGEQTVNLSGISPGPVTGKVTLKITAATSAKTLIPAPKINYTSPNSAGTLSFKPAKNATGTATITVTVNNGQAQNNTVTRTFTITVNPFVTRPPTLNPISDLVIAENAGVQKISLSGISPGSSDTGKTPKLRITAASSNPALFKKATVTYKNSGTGTLTLTPTKNAVGTATIVVTANNGQKANNLVVRSFTVTVSSSPTTSVASKMVVKEMALVTVPLPAPALLTPATHANGQFALTVAGSAGTNYVVEASTDLVNWVPVATNTAPFTFTDTQAGQFKQRFYRSVSAQ
jgi:hypothetical protein